jgi:hypothetical protein
MGQLSSVFQNHMVRGQIFGKLQGGGSHLLTNLSGLNKKGLRVGEGFKSTVPVIAIYLFFWNPAL